MIRIDRFDMSDMDDRAEAKLRDQAAAMHSCLYDLAQALRNNAKYSPEHGSWNEAKDIFWEICKQHNIDPFED